MPVEMRWNGGAASGDLRAAAAQGLFLAAEHVLSASKKIVPHREGTLADSGATDVDEGSLTASISYDTPYAARQHEELDWRHDAGRQAKYLEQPLSTEAQAVVDIIGGEIRKVL